MKDIKSFDIIVVGSGLAGLTAAIMAADLGNSVLIVEKMPVCGGTSLVSVGAIAVSKSEAQKRLGITDSDELFYSDIIKCGENNNQTLVKKLVSMSNSAFKFLKSHGAEYSDKLFAVDGHSIPRCFQPPAGLGVNVIKPLLEYFKAKPDSTILTETKVCGLLKDSNGRVTGIKVSAPSGFNVINSSKAVIIAAGGFSRDAFFMKPERSMYKNIPTYTHKGADSETLRMLISEGAETCDTEYVRFGTSIAFNDIEKGALIDVKSGKRFVSESASRQNLTDVILKTSCAKDWPVLILDSGAIRRISNDDKLENMLAKGEMQKFQSIEHLVSFFKIDFKALSENLNLYNKSIRNSGLDEFGKDFQKSDAKPIDSAPFYACPVYLRLNYTQGGVLINEHAQVIAKTGGIIEGLYAAGEVTGGVHGKVRLTGCSTVDCAVFGLIAAKKANAEGDR